MVKDYLKILAVDEHVAIPKSVQLSNAFLHALEKGDLLKDDLLPSAIELSEQLNIPISVIEALYKGLQDNQVILPVPGEETFLVNSGSEKPLSILVLFNKLSRHKKIILDAFIQALAGRYLLDFHIYHNELRIFKKILKQAEKKDYARYMVIPSFEEDDQRAYHLLNAIPKEKLLLIDKLDPLVKGNFAAVYEDFEKDIYDSLQQLNGSLSKYQTIKLLYPDNSYYPKAIINGFSRYCIDYAFDYAVFSDIHQETIRENVAYICLSEDDLILLVDKMLVSGYKIGKDIGVISYNETPIKKLIVNGVTTISTDFRLMGAKAAEMVSSPQHDLFAVPSAVIIRNSL